jgi:hypothetical protein
MQVWNWFRPSNPKKLTKSKSGWWDTFSSLFRKREQTKFKSESIDMISAIREDQDSSKERVLRWIEQSSSHTFQAQVVIEDQTSTRKVQSLAKKSRSNSRNSPNTKRSNARASLLDYSAASIPFDGLQESDQDDMFFESFERAIRVIADQRRSSTLSDSAINY